MKKSTASKPSINWFPFLVVVVPWLWGMAFWLRDWPLAVINACMSAYLVLDVWHLVRIKRAAQKDLNLLK
jgi:hypothetical protein